MIIWRYHSGFFLNLLCVWYFNFNVWIWLRIHYRVATPVHRVGGWVSPNLTPVESVPPYPTPLSGKCPTSWNVSTCSFPVRMVSSSRQTRKEPGQSFSEVSSPSVWRPQSRLKTLDHLRLASPFTENKKGRSQMSTSTICRLQILFTDVLRVHVFIFGVHGFAFRCEPPLFCQMRNWRRNKGETTQRVATEPNCKFCVGF